MSLFDFEPFEPFEPIAPVFPEAAPPANYTDTSQAAADSVAPKAPNQRRRIYEFIDAKGDDGATNEEIAAALDMPQSGTSARVNELQGHHKTKSLPVLVRDSGRTRLTRYGKAAIVWISLPFAPRGEPCPPKTTPPTNGQ